MGAAGHGSGRTEFHGPAASIDTQSASPHTRNTSPCGRGATMIETGATYEDLGAVAIAQRAYAQANDRAVIRGALTPESYLASPFVADPSADQTARPRLTGLALCRDDTRSGAHLRHSPRWFVELHTSLATDLVLTSGMPCSGRTTHATTQACSPRRSGLRRLGPTEIDFAELYDCFSSTVLFGLEGLGFVGRVKQAALCEREHSTRRPATNQNTNGGLLCEGYLHGMNTVAEAVLQIQGRMVSARYSSEFLRGHVGRDDGRIGLGAHRA